MHIVFKENIVFTLKMLYVNADLLCVGATFTNCHRYTVREKHTAQKPSIMHY